MSMTDDIYELTLDIDPINLYYTMTIQLLLANNCSKTMPHNIKTTYTISLSITNIISSRQNL